MDGNQESRIRERAHVIWEREGRPQGREIAHWAMASEEIAAEAAKRTRAAAGAGEAKKARAPKRAAAASASTPSKSRKTQ